MLRGMEQKGRKSLNTWLKNVLKWITLFHFGILSEIDCLTISDLCRQGIVVERSHDEQKGSINRPDDRRVGHDGAQVKEIANIWNSS